MSGDILAQVMRREKYREWKREKQADEVSKDEQRRRSTSGGRSGSSNDRRTERPQAELGSFSGTEASSEA